MRRLILTFFIISLGLISFAQDSTESAASMEKMVTRRANWQENFTKAQELSKKQNKPLLLFFTGSDWCGPCKMLHKDFFETEQFIKIADKDLILYEADFPRRKDILSTEKKKENTKLQSKYSIRGFPTIIILNAKGVEIGRRVGYTFMRDPKPHFDLIDKIIKSKL
jgi:thioredoxin-related protein